MTQQRTKWNNLQNKISSYLLDSFLGSWRRRSIALIALLAGFYVGSNITVYFLEQTGTRPLVVLIMVSIIELLIRLRTLVDIDDWPITWLLIDNLRIGVVYAVVLEAFKLGS